MTLILTRQDEETPLFIANDIVEFERQAMLNVAKAKGAITLLLSDIDEAKESLPSSNKM